MRDIEMDAAGEIFARCWAAAGRHIQAQGQGGVQWLKARLEPPFLEHLSFRLGNQLFFVRIFDIDGRVSVPGNEVGYRAIAEGYLGHPCLMPMQERLGDWEPFSPGWGLVDPETGKILDPVSLVSDELIEMTDWELQDFAVQIVRAALKKDGREIMSSQGSPRINPSIWFVGDDGPEWVLVRAARYPAKEAPMPADIDEIAWLASRNDEPGHFASVSVSSAAERDNVTGHPVPLWRGHALNVRYPGLSRLKPHAERLSP